MWLRERATRKVLADLAATVARLREEVQAMGAVLDRLLAWVRTCPDCKQEVLRKEDPTKPVRCPRCGWVWE